MICEDSASKRYRFPFDLESSPVPTTPSVSSMAGIHNHGVPSDKPTFRFDATEPAKEGSSDDEPVSNDSSGDLQYTNLYDRPSADIDEEHDEDENGAEHKTIENENDENGS